MLEYEGENIVCDRCGVNTNKKVKEYEVILKHREYFCCCRCSDHSTTTYWHDSCKKCFKEIKNSLEGK